MTFLSSEPSTNNNLGGGREPESDPRLLLRAIRLSNFYRHLFCNLKQVFGVLCDVQLAVLALIKAY